MAKRYAGTGSIGRHSLGYPCSEIVSPKIVKVRVQRALSSSGLGDIDYALNPYIGCYHACVYCYAREFVSMKRIARYWGEIIVVKTNIADVLRDEVGRHKRGIVGIGTITDAYQPVESEFQITRQCVETLLSAGFAVTIQTKSDLILRDLDVLTSRPSLVDVGFTITTLDSSIARLIEPRAPSPQKRVAALERIASAGIKTWVFLGPIIPGYNDDLKSISEVIEVAAATGSVLYYDKFRVKRFMLQNPELRNWVEKARSYPWKKLFKTIEILCQKRGVVCIYSGDMIKSSILRSQQRKLDSYSKPRN